MEETSSSKLTEIVIGTDDMKNSRDFFELFNIEMTPELDAIIKQIEAAGSDKLDLKLQEQFRYRLCQAMLQSQHEMFKDPLFEKPLDNMRRIVYESSFDEQLVDAIGTDEPAE